MDALLKKMTLDDKIGQITQRTLEPLEIRNGEVTGESLEKLFGVTGCGVIASPFADLETVAIKAAAAQRYLREKTRLGIPAIQTAECLHGQLAGGATIFPHAVAQGSMWNPTLIRRMASAVAREASFCGVTQALSPLFDLARDPRWGRVEECYGEDPYHVARCGVAFVAGMQGGGGPQTGVRPGKLMCTAKHFAAHGVAANGLNLGPVSMGEREMRALYLEPFEAAIREAGVCAVMPSYNESDGIPSHANAFLLRKILRDEWGFGGYVFSDYGGVEMLQNFQKVAADLEEAAASALMAGVDLEAPNPLAYPKLADAVRRGTVPVRLIDEAVARVLSLKFLCGLFDDRRKISLAGIRKKVRCAAHIELAREMAGESIVLLKNDKNLLPLDAERLRSIAVIGPNADQVQFGGYSFTRSNKAGVTTLAGLKARLGPKTEVNYAKGCGLSSLSRDGFAGAVAAAKSSDVAVLVLGETAMPYTEDKSAETVGSEPAIGGEGYDLTDLHLPGVQEDLLKAVHATGTPVVVVLVNGRAYGLEWMAQNVGAIVEAWYPGEQGGAAIAGVLVGDINPSGRLPVSFPRTVGHVQTVYNYRPSGRGFYRQPGTPENPGRDFVFSSPDPLFAFGFGLSYTTFKYDSLRVTPAETGVNGKLRISCSITNTGDREGKEVAQVYVCDKVSSVTTPVMALKRFRKVRLGAGKAGKLTFELPVRELALWNVDMKRVVEPGEFEIMVGASAEDIRLRTTVRVNDR